MIRILKWPVPIDDHEHQIGPGPVVHVGPDPQNQDRRSVFVWTEEPDQHDRPTQYALIVGTGQRYDGWLWCCQGSVIDPPFVWHLLTRKAD